MDTSIIINNLRREGNSWQKIADHLNANGVPTRYRNSRWWPGTVKILVEGYKRPTEEPKDPKYRRDSFLAVMAERARGTRSHDLAGALNASTPALGPWTDVSVANSLIYPIDFPRLSRFRIARFLLEVYKEHQGLSYKAVGAQLAHMRLWTARTSGLFVESFHKELKPLSEQDIHADIKQALLSHLSPAEILAEFQRTFPYGGWTAVRLAKL